jgi:hypothetical protein
MFWTIGFVTKYPFDVMQSFEFPFALLSKTLNMCTGSLYLIGWTFCETQISTAVTYLSKRLDCSKYYSRNSDYLTLYNRLKLGDGQAYDRSCD